MENINYRKVINASGKMSILGTSVVNDDVIKGMKFGAQNFFIMAEYLSELESKIASMTGFEDAKISASAASSLVLTTAAVISRGDAHLARNPYLESHTQREIIIPKGHNVNFNAPVDTMIMMGGGKIVEAGYANECSTDHIVEKISENTAGIMYIKSHHSVQKNMLSIEDAVEIAKKHKIPLIVDAAAEDDILSYNNKDIDLIIFSGSKAMSGPNSAMILGKKSRIAWLNPLGKGLGRSMKVSKEAASGLYVAVSKYLENDKPKNYLNLISYVEEINKLKEVSSSIKADPAGRDIERIAIKSDRAKKIIERFEAGNPAIFTRNYLVNDGIIEIDTRSIDRDDMNVIVERLKEVMNE